MHVYMQSMCVCDRYVYVIYVCMWFTCVCVLSECAITGVDSPREVLCQYQHAIIFFRATVHERASISCEIKYIHKHTHAHKYILGVCSLVWYEWMCKNLEYFYVLKMTRTINETVLYNIACISIMNKVCQSNSWQFSYLSKPGFEMSERAPYCLIAVRHRFRRVVQMKSYEH